MSLGLAPSSGSLWEATPSMPPSDVKTYQSILVAAKRTLSYEQWEWKYLIQNLNLSWFYAIQLNNNIHN